MSNIQTYEDKDISQASDIPPLADIEDPDEDALVRINQLIDTMNGSTMGLEMQDDDWSPPYCKIKHNTTRDSMCPDEASVGAIFSRDGETLWEKGDKEPFKFVVLYGWKQHTRFRPGDSYPDCKSLDGEINIYGDLKCENCPDYPWRNGEIQDCRRSLHFLIMPLDLSGIYRIDFSKTSYPAGSTITKSLSNMRETWKKVIGLRTEEQTSGNNRYPVYRASPISSEKPSEELMAFAEYVSWQWGQVREERLETIRNKREELEDVVEEIKNESLSEAVDSDSGGFNDGGVGFEDTM